MRAIPAFREPGPRLELMDELGVDRSLMFPTLASLVEERMRDDPALIHVVVHALNQWLDEAWGFNYQDRIFTVPVISLPIVDKAIEELDWVVERGARAILVRPAPVPGYRGPRSFALPEFDPFWQRVVEHDVLVAMHSSDSGYARYTAEWEGGDKRRCCRSRRTPSRCSTSGGRSRTRWPRGSATARCSAFPELKVAVIENGSQLAGAAARSAGRRLQEDAARASSATRSRRSRTASTSARSTRTDWPSWSI